MKLRIKGDSLRLRLSQSEITRLIENGKVASGIQFGSLPGDSLTYCLASSSVDQICTIFSGGRIEIQVPSERIESWAQSEEVSIEDNINNGSEAGLRILIEKDFACLTERKHEDDSDAFPNPNTYC